MSPLTHTTPPAPRILGRLVARLRDEGGGSSAFVLAGDALATSRLGCGRAPLDDDALELADAMSGALLEVDVQAHRADPDGRVRVAIATAILSFARPRLARSADGWVDAWTGPGLGAAGRMSDPVALAARALFALRRGDLSDAASAADRLAEIDGDAIAGAIHDWAVARVQGHGAEREASCFEHLVLDLGGRHPALVLVAAAVWARQAGLDPATALQRLTDRFDSRGFRRARRRDTGT
jgi:hypothetical protein